PRVMAEAARKACSELADPDNDGRPRSWDIAINEGAVIYLWVDLWWRPRRGRRPLHRPADLRLLRHPQARRGVALVGPARELRSDHRHRHAGRVGLAGIPWVGSRQGQGRHYGPHWLPHLGHPLRTSSY